MDRTLSLCVLHPCRGEQFRTRTRLTNFSHRIFASGSLTEIDFHCILFSLLNTWKWEQLHAACNNRYHNVRLHALKQLYYMENNNFRFLKTVLWYNKLLVLKSITPIDMHIFLCPLFSFKIIWKIHDMFHFIL